MPPKTKSFTLKSDGILRVLKTPIWIGPAFDHARTGPPALREYVGIWDTGATNCVVNRKVIDECALPPIGVIQVNTVNNSSFSNVYLISILCPNKQGFSTVRATHGEILGADVLVGMDVIASGDFAVTNFERKTTLSYRWPPSACIDFTNRNPSVGTTEDDLVPQVGRNEPCPCGSGKKYKYCHGARS